MKINIDELMNNSFVLSVYEDRMNLIKRIFDYNGLKIGHFFNGFKNNDIVKMFNTPNKNRDANAYKCSLGHAALVKMAKSLNLPYICIFEDDAYPCKDVNKTLQKYMNEIPQDTDILMMGWSFVEHKPQPINQYFTRVNYEIHGSHSYIIFQRAYDRYLEYYDNNPSIPSDLILYSFKNANVVRTNEQIFIQFNVQMSNWGCVGYTYEENYRNKTTKTPPSNFIPFDNLKK